MWGLLGDVFLLLNLPHQAVEVLIHLGLVGNLVLPLAVLEGLHVRVDTGGQPVLLGFFGLLALTLGLNLPVQELLGLHLLLFPVISLNLLPLGLSVILNLGVMVNTLEVLLELVVAGDADGEDVLA